MSQGSLDFGRSDRVVRAADKLRRTLLDAVEAIGWVVAAGACDCAKSDLHHALHERNDRYVRIEWLMAIADAAPDARARILGAMADCWGFVCAAAKPLTAEDRLARLEQKVATLGSVGAAWIEETKR